MNEIIWKDVQGFEGKYQVNILGQIRSLPTLGKKGGWRKSKILKSGDDMSGYQIVSLCVSGISKHTKTVHRLVAQAFIENPCGKPQINHKDGNKRNNHADNLEWCTAGENIRHSYKYLRKEIKGEMCAHSKLNNEQVLQIRSKYKFRVYGMPKLATEYGVCMSTIQAIIERKNWSHI